MPGTAGGGAARQALALILRPWHHYKRASARALGGAAATGTRPSAAHAREHAVPFSQPSDDIHHWSCQRRVAVRLDEASLPLKARPLPSRR